jgi:hypothetical protein
MEAGAPVETEDAFWAWCNEAAPGECREYFSGATVRGDGGLKYPLAQVAWTAYELGLVVLTQRRTGDENSPFVWLATRRARNAPPPIISEGHRKAIAQTDWSTAEGARQLAQKIEAYWHRSVHWKVHAWTERVPFQADCLVGAVDAGGGHAVRHQPVDALAGEPDLPILGRVELHDAVEDRGLAGAVGDDVHKLDLNESGMRCRSCGGDTP